MAKVLHFACLALRNVFQRGLAKALLFALEETGACFMAGYVLFFRLLEEDGQGTSKCWSPPRTCEGEPCGQNLDRPARAPLQAPAHTGPGLYRSEL